MGFHFGLEGGGVKYQFGEDFVLGAEMFCGGGEVEGKGGRLVDHGRNPLVVSG
jgi:hypothetical protein